jgi:UDP-N-acetylglucosamine--N-acetylmuramyl-(pentapeptide) pyrophosphoryl-undecaprenol N-acetylglucosamine transferase
MNDHSSRTRAIAIACGGTGGHLFPGIAVAEKLAERGCDVTLLISPKEVDQQAVKNLKNVAVVTLPAVGLKRGCVLDFLRGFYRSHRAVRRLFQARKPDAVLAMGGFTSAPPILAAKSAGARTFLHESNTIPGRANQWLSWVVDHAFVGFPSAVGRFKRCRVTVSGTPARPQFNRSDAASCRYALGLDPGRPVLLAMGGSQGASGINELVIRSLPLFAKVAPECQWFHLTGPKDASHLQQAYAGLKLKAVVQPFFDRMELALGAASAAVSRAGASSLAELAAMRLPAVLIPFPAATDNHQFHNARAYATSGAAQLLEQSLSTPEVLAKSLLQLAKNETVRQAMQTALARWERPQAASEIAEAILEAISSQRTLWSAVPKSSSVAGQRDLPAQAIGPVAIRQVAVPMASTSFLSADPGIQPANREVSATL